MALRNTTDRYQYIYGNNARQAERVYTESAAPAKKNPNRSSEKKSRARIRIQETFDSKFMTTLIGALVIICVGAMFCVNETERTNRIGQEIKVLKTEKAQLQSEQVALQSEIDKSINLDEIREYAEKKLKLVVPDHSSILYYDQDSSDYFRQYENME